MAKMGGFNASDLRRFQQNLNKLQNDTQMSDYFEACAKELAARLLAKVKKRTPVGDYPKESGKKGGTLRRGWTVGEIRKEGHMYIIDITNPTEYASYVEYGHRTRNHKGWVNGRFMMTISEQELEQIAPKVLENKLKKFLGGAFQ
jgi:hypothetical protein